MELPEELMTLILSKLPAKSLLRFKCIQKSWYSLINSPYFINLHRRNTKKNDCFLVKRKFSERPRLERHVLSLHSYETLEELCGSQINIPFLFVGHLELCGSCDGLVCLSNWFNQIVICNPTIREFRSIFIPRSFGVSFGYRIDSIAFGSDPNTGQYTVVMIGVPIDDYALLDEDIPDDREARLYDFSSDTWRKTAVVIPGPFPYSRRAVSLNGAFHWCPCPRPWDDDDSNNILTFRMSNEVTEFMPLPDFAEVTHSKQLCVSTKSQLSLVVYFHEEWLEIWVMTEYGVKESWTRLFRITRPLLPDILRPIPFWDEQRLLLTSTQRQLVSCDLQNHQNLCYFPIDGDCDLSPYSQSLVSVNGIEHSIF